MQLREGLQVVILPAGERNRDGQAEVVGEEETLNVLNDFLAQIAAQGGEVIAAFNRTVVQPSERKGGFGRPEERLFFVVKK